MRILPFFLLLLSITGFAQKSTIDTSKITGHPRLLLLQGQEEPIKKSIAENPVWSFANNQLTGECDQILSLPKIERVLTGRRLLDQSRECLRRVFYLSYAWRITGQKKYARKCEEELLSVSKFSDWNPDHYLDVAEMTMAVAIGYDWLYNYLQPASRDLIRNAIITKGIMPSFNKKYNGWLTGTNNWNQVCNTGMAYGALAIYEDTPQLAAKVINRSIESIHTSMTVYAPDGGYPEGYNYWGYGTTYNVFLISALERLFGTDYGLSQQPGFLKTGAFYENLETPAGYAFNYSDAGNGGNQDGLQPAMFWFAEKLHDPTLLFSERDNLLKSTRFPVKWNRFLPAIMLWGTHINLNDITPPNYKIWTGKGENEVVMMRTAWDDPNAIFVGLKAGSPSASHGHMDVGSFVMDADGVRWGADPGMQEYESLESKGIKLWSNGQNEERWKVFR
ncbi:chondroitin AC/alginate lyase, partial [Russula earlei]